MNINLYKVCLNRLLKLNVDRGLAVYVADQGLPQWRMNRRPIHVLLVRFNYHNLFFILLYKDGNVAYQPVGNTIYGGNRIKVVTESIEVCYKFFEDEVGRK